MAGPSLAGGIGRTRPSHSGRRPVARPPPTGFWPSSVTNLTGREGWHDSSRQCFQRLRLPSPHRDRLRPIASPARVAFAADVPDANDAQRRGVFRFKRPGFPAYPLPTEDTLTGHRAPTLRHSMRTRRQPRSFLEQDIFVEVWLPAD